jgi:hypothetical protein
LTDRADLADRSHTRTHQGRAIGTTAIPAAGMITKLAPASAPASKHLHSMIRKSVQRFSEKIMLKQ